MLSINKQKRAKNGQNDAKHEKSLGLSCHERFLSFFLSFFLAAVVKIMTRHERFSMLLRGRRVTRHNTAAVILRQYHSAGRRRTAEEFNELAKAMSGRA